jgi:hypothetical protein
VTIPITVTEAQPLADAESGPRPPSLLRLGLSLSLSLRLSLSLNAGG